MNHPEAYDNARRLSLAQYTYDDRSRRTNLTYANGARIEYEYDVASRVLDVNNVTNSGSLTYSYLYDHVGNRTSMAVTDGSGTRMHVYDYDTTYQLTDVNYPEEMAYLATDSEFSYDAAGNRLSVIDGGGTTSYTSNSLNQYTADGTIEYTYDDNGNMTFDGVNEYLYDPENRLIEVHVERTTALSTACDTTIPITTGGVTNWSVTSVGSYYGGSCAVSGDIDDYETSWMEMKVVGPGTVSFWWKVSSEYGDYLEFYVDDELQPRASIQGVVGWTQSSAYQITGAGTHTLRWQYIKDGSGTENDDCGWVDYVQWSGYTPEQPPGTWETLNYVYDASGRRIEKKYDGNTQVKFVYDGDHCIAEYNGSGVLQRKYIYGPGIDQPVCMIEGAATSYYHFDALGSVVALSNAAGNTIQVYEYSVWGQVGASDPNHTNPFMFTARRFDKETGLYYYRARYYNPEIGRFLQTDPIGYRDDMNLYRYCKNNPVCWTDPSGSQGRNGIDYIDTNDILDANSCYETLTSRLNELAVSSSECLTDFPGSIIAKNVAACITICFCAAALGGAEGYGICFAGCAAVAGFIDMGLVSACRQAVERDVRDAREHYNFCICKKGGGTTRQCALDHISDANDLPWWARIFG